MLPPPRCAEDLLKAAKDSNIELCNIWENACGEGHLAKVFENHGKLGKASDLIDRGYGQVQDFLTDEHAWTGDIVTNPPYKYATEFLVKSMESLKEGRYYCAFLKILFLEGQARRKVFEKYPPRYIFVYSKRQDCAKNGDFKSKGSSAVAYAWFIWQKGYTGESVVKWI